MITALVEREGERMAARAGLARRARQADREDAGADPGDAEPGGERHVLADQPAAQQRDQQRRGAAHERIGEAELAVLVGADQRHVVADVDDDRGREPRQRLALRQADGRARAAAPTPQPRTWISAVSSALSLPDLMSAFHDAWSRAPNRTAAMIGQLSAGVIGRRRARSAARAVEEVRERRRRQVGLLGEVVPLAQPHRVVRAGLGDEGGRLRRRRRRRPAARGCASSRPRAAS